MSSCATSCAGGLHVALGQTVAAAHQRRRAGRATFSARATSAGVALDDQLVALRADADVELRFELLEVLVVGAEQRLEPLLGDLNLAHRGGMANSSI